MSSDAFDFVLKRRPTPTPPPPFVCVICERKIECDPWLNLQREPYRHQPPVCASCAGHWGKHTHIPRITRGDNATLYRLVAVTTALKWEAFNGKYSKRRYAA